MAWACCWECSPSQLADVKSANAPSVYSARLPDTETETWRDVNRNGVMGMKVTDSTMLHLPCYMAPPGRTVHCVNRAP